MNGEKFNSFLGRRGFLKLSGMLIALPFLNSCRPSKKTPAYDLKITGANSKTGHLLRENNFPPPTLFENINTLIVGGGISGLSAARWLKKNNHHDFKLVELDISVGGNSNGAENKISAYPFAAHYLPIPDESFKELIDFLNEHQIITGFDKHGLPIYNEDYICFEPQERLFYKGIWQDGLPPKNGLSALEKNELKRFLQLTENFKTKIGSDNRQAFTIPLELSSSDEEWMQFDKITIAEYLRKEKYSSEFLYWYINYCCKDDFGTDIENTSAWAAFHYFSSRKGKASNASSYDLLAWPEGNHFLTKKLASNISQHFYTNSLTYKVEKHDDKWNCYVYDVIRQCSIKYSCSHVIMATPQFVNKHLLAFETGIQWNDFNYYPWIVANISILNKKELNGMEELSWDNVFYNSKSLGYVNACHQNIDQRSEKTVLTYYYNFSEKSAKEEKEAIQSKDSQFWKNFIVNDLKKAHPNIEEIIEEIDLTILGHGMISPGINFRNNTSRILLEKGLGTLHFAHSDMSGVSIFEQAFYRGLLAANKVLKTNNENVND